MIKFFKEKNIKINNNNLIKLVLDVEQYHHFVPYCQKSIIEKSQSDDHFLARTYVSFNKLNYSFLSDIKYININNKEDIIEIKALDGPFKYLTSSWKFIKIEDKLTKTIFKIDFSFDSFLLKKIISLLFNSISSKIIKSFEKRAYQLYNNIDNNHP